MESLMLEKGKIDQLDISLNRMPRKVSDFTIDFLNLHFGLKSLAIKQLKALLTSLEELYKLGHPYGIFFCRLLGIYHPRPLPLNLSVYLIVIQEIFNKKTLPSKLSSFAKNYEILQYGGVTSIIDIMELVMEICKKRRDIGERIIYSMYKDSENKIEICLLKVIGTMARTGKNPEHFFEILDINHGGSLDYHEFVDGIRYNLNI